MNTPIIFRHVDNPNTGLRDNKIPFGYFHGKAEQLFSHMQSPSDLAFTDDELPELKQGSQLSAFAMIEDDKGSQHPAVVFFQVMKNVPCKVIKARIVLADDWEAIHHASNFGNWR